MDASHIMARTFIWLGVAAWIAPGASTTVLAQVGMKLEVKVGLSGRPVQDRYNPVFVDLTPAPEPGTSVVVTVTPLGAEGFSFDPSQARVPLSHHRFQLRYPEHGEALSVPVPLNESALRLRVEVETADGRTAIRTLNQPSLGDPFILVLSRRREALSFLADALGAVVIAEPRALPTDWRCYDGVNRVVLDDLRLDQLTPATVAALRASIGWRMGALVTGPGLQANAGSPLLGPLAAVRVAGETPPSYQVGLAEWLSGVAEGAGKLQPLSLLHLSNAGGATLVRSDGRPAVLRARGLRSFLVACAFDPAQLAWDNRDASYQGRAKAWRQLLSLAGEGPAIYFEPEAVVDSLVPREAQVSGMSTPILILLAVFALVLGPVNFLVVRRARRREWMLVTVPLMVGVFLVAAVVVSRASFGQQALFCAQTAVVGAAGQDLALEVSQFGLLSRRQQPQTFGLPERALIATPSQGIYPWDRPTGLEARPISRIESDRRQIILAEVWQRPRSMRFFGAGRVTETRPPVAEAHLEGSELVGSFNNTLGYTLEDALVVVRWRSARLGKIAAGETKTFRIKLGPPAKYKQADGSAIFYHSASAWLSLLPEQMAWGANSPRRAFMQALVSRSRRDFEEPVVLGWGGPESPVVSPEAKRSDMRVVAVHVPVTPITGERVELPAGIVSRLFESDFGLLPERAYDEGEGRRQINIFQLPIAPGPLADCILTIHSYATGPRWLKNAVGPGLSLLDWQRGSWEKVSKSTNGKGEIRLSHAARFVKQPEAWVAVRVDQEEEDSSYQCSDEECYEGYRAYLSYLDLSFEGKRT